MKKLINHPLSTKVFIFIILIISIFSQSVNSKSSICPQKIVSLTLASDEILIKIVEDKSRISGVTYLAADKTISNIHTEVANIKGIHANLEQIIELDPDLLIVSIYKNQDVKEQIKKAGIKTLYLEDIISFESLKNNILKIGDAVCESNNAQTLIINMEENLELITKKIPTSKAKPRILYYSPPGFTAGENSTINEIIEKSGGINIGRAIGKNSYERISLEYVVESNPDIILLSSYNPSHSDFRKEFVSNSIIKEIPAIKSNKIVIIPGKYLTSASHYVIYAVDELINQLLKIHWKIEKSN